MYESYYGFDEKPFSLTPDPKYLFRSEVHGSACELLHYAVKRREGFVVITGDIGTGKTTLCRALVDQLDDRTFTALVLDPFVSEADLLRHILCELGVVSREDFRRADRWVSKQSLVDTLNEFLLSLLPLGACALGDHRRSAESIPSRARTGAHSVESRNRQGKAAADRARGAAEPRRHAPVTRAPSARPTDLDSASVAASDSP